MQRSSLSWRALIVWPLAAGGYELGNLVLELSDPNNDLFKALDHEAASDHAHFVAQGLETNLPTMVGEADQSPPGFEAVEGLGLLKDGLSLAADTQGQETPDGAVEGVGVVGLFAVPVPGCQLQTDGGLVPLLSDWLGLAFRPLEERVDGRDS